MIVPVLQEIRTVLQQSNELVLYCHLDPDGDALGSLLGLGLTLKDSGWRVQMISPDGVPTNFRFLPGAKDVLTSLTTLNYRATTIVLDCGDLGRLGTAAHEVTKLPHVINIDHHPTNTEFGTINWVEPKASATAEMIFFLIRDLSLPLSMETATCLYTGIHTDTGGFRYENTTAKVHNVAEQLLKKGVKPWEIADRVYDTKSMDQLRLLQKAIERLQVTPDGRIAWISLPSDEFVSYHGRDISGLINYPRMVAGAEVAVLLKEEAGDLVRVGLRSRRLVNVGLLAKGLGGGGHARAAGCIIPGPLAQAEERVLATVQKALQEVQNHA